MFNVFNQNNTQPSIFPSFPTTTHPLNPPFSSNNVFNQPHTNNTFNTNTFGHTSNNNVFGSSLNTVSSTPSAFNTNAPVFMPHQSSHTTTTATTHNSFNKPINANYSNVTNTNKSAPICRFYGTPRGCSKGGNCPFQHIDTTNTNSTAIDSDSVDDAVDMNSNVSVKPVHRSKQVCHFYNTPAGCRTGDTCPFIHDNKPTNDIRNDSYDHHITNNEYDNSYNNNMDDYNDSMNNDECNEPIQHSKPIVTTRPVPHTTTTTTTPSVDRKKPVITKAAPNAQIITKGTKLIQSFNDDTKPTPHKRQTVITTRNSPPRNNQSITKLQWQPKQQQQVAIGDEHNESQQYGDQDDNRYDEQYDCDHDDNVTDYTNTVPEPVTTNKSIDNKHAPSSIREVTNKDTDIKSAARLADRSARFGKTIIPMDDSVNSIKPGKPIIQHDNISGDSDELGDEDDMVGDSTAAGITGMYISVYYMITRSMCIYDIYSIITGYAVIISSLS